MAVVPELVVTAAQPVSRPDAVGILVVISAVPISVPFAAPSRKLTDVALALTWIVP